MGPATRLSRPRHRVRVQGSAGSDCPDALASDQPELALVAFKRAKSTASSSATPWLRIAQARCLAAQKQFAVATTILSSPASSQDTRVRVAALATLGSIKMHSGAYEQGAEILNRTLTENPTVKWSGRLDAEADLAAAQLILGDLDEALESLHAVQQNYHLAGRWQVSLGHDITERDQIVPVSLAVHIRPASTANRDRCDIQRFVR